MQTRKDQLVKDNQRALARFRDPRSGALQNRSRIKSFKVGLFLLLSKTRLVWLPAVLLQVLLMSYAATASAQQTIFNVPTTDVLDKGKAYGELDFSFKPNNSDSVNRFSSFVPRVVVGTG